MPIPEDRKALHEAVLEAFRRCCGRKKGELQRQSDGLWNGVWQTTFAGLALAGDGYTHAEDRYVTVALMAKWFPYSATLVFEVVLVNEDEELVGYLCAMEEKITGVEFANDDCVIFRAGRGRRFVLYDYRPMLFSRADSYHRFRTEVNL